MSRGRLPWEIVETFPSTDAALIAQWTAAVDGADADAETGTGTDTARIRSRIGTALALYWAIQESATDLSATEVAARRDALLDAAERGARDLGDPDVLAEALLGVLYSTWGPDHHLSRDPLIDELHDLIAEVRDEEIRLRIIEWEVLRDLDHGDIDAARRSIRRFTDTAVGTELVLFTRREELWRGCLAMLDGHLDESLRINQTAISATANVAGSPFSFQNVAITMSIERFLRRGLSDVVDSIRSILASSPRVGANWQTGLAFALSETGEIEEATALFRSLSVNRFECVPRDLNWLVTMQLLGFVALRIGAEDDGLELLDQLRPFAHLDGTHGSGYASYGPVGRVVGALAGRWGDPDESEAVFAATLTSRAPGPWTSLTRLARATARRTRSPLDALVDAREAEDELRRMGLEAWESVAFDLVGELSAAGHDGPVAQRDGHGWSLHHSSGSASVPSSRGLDHIVWLLSRPGRGVDVSELDPLADRSLPIAATTESTLDPAARAAYRRRLTDIDDLRNPSPDTIREAEFLRRELAGARHAPSSSAELERLRVRVTKAIRRSIGLISAQSPGLGAHLSASIETGRTCAYQPVDGRAWVVSRR